MRLAALLAAALAFPALAQEPAPAVTAPSSAAPPSPARPPEAADLGARPVQAAAVLEEITGTVTGIDRKAQRLEVATAKGPVTLQLDRNTLVYTQGSLGTVLDLAPGQAVRAGRNATSTAYWVLVRPASANAPPKPASGPGSAAGPRPAPIAGPAGGTASPSPAPATQAPATPAPSAPAPAEQPPATPAPSAPAPAEQPPATPAPSAPAPAEQPPAAPPGETKP
jgi:hypothetical protein